MNAKRELISHQIGYPTQEKHTQRQINESIIEGCQVRSLTDAWEQKTITKLWSDSFYLGILERLGKTPSGHTYAQTGTVADVKESASKNVRTYHTQ